MDAGLVIVIIAVAVLAALVVVLLLRGEQVMGRLRHLAESDHNTQDRLTERLPTLGQLARPLADIAEAAERIAVPLAERLGDGWSVATAECHSQIGSGALPVESLPSRAVAIAPAAAGKRGTGTALKRLAAAFSRLPRPVIGRIQDDRLMLDLRCLDDEAAFTAQLAELEPPRR